MQKNLKLADTCEECMYRNLFFEVRNELKAIERKLVRCEDCKKAKSWKCPLYRAGYTYKADDYCSDGERIEE